MFGFAISRPLIGQLSPFSISHWLKQQIRTPLPIAFLFQLEVDILLTGLTAQQIGTTARCKEEYIKE